MIPDRIACRGAGVARRVGRTPAVAVALAGAMVLALGACAGSGRNGPHGASHDASTLPMGMPAYDKDALGTPDTVFGGPQGRSAQFVVECGFSHQAPDDPIVHPGRPGASHTHVFFGNTTTDAASTVDSLARGDTTCDQRLDRAAYWAPALYDGDQLVTPEKSTAYYRPGPGIDALTVQPYPPGLELIGGDVTATEPQPLTITSWTCGTGIERTSRPPECPAGRGLRMIVTFPDCWNGTDLRSADLRSHVAYSHAGSCDAAHPVPVPQLTLTISYPITGGGHDLRLASGDTITAHADFLNAWDEDKLAGEVEMCLHRGVVCNITSGRKSG